MVSIVRPHLEYAPVAPLLRRRRIRRIVLGLVLLALAAAAWWLGPAGWKQAQLLYWQRQCMTYVRPDATPAWEPDPVKAAALLSTNPDYLAAPGGPAIHLPQCLRQYERLGGFPPSSTFEPILLVHQMRTPSGRRRLVVIWGTVDDSLTATVYAPAGAWSAPRQVGGGSYMDPYPLMTGVRVPSSTYQNGQVDPADPSRFTVPRFLRHNNTAWQAMEGRLTDADQIVFRTIDIRGK
jgi:hypothetical protein